MAKFLKLPMMAICGKMGPQFQGGRFEYHAPSIRMTVDVTSFYFPPDGSLENELKRYLTREGSKR